MKSSTNTKKSVRCQVSFVACHLSPAICHCKTKCTQWSNIQHTSSDIATYRLNRPMSWLSENGVVNSSSLSSSDIHRMNGEHTHKEGILVNQSYISDFIAFHLDSFAPIFLLFHCRLFSVTAAAGGANVDRLALVKPLHWRLHTVLNSECGIMHTAQ